MILKGTERGENMTTRRDTEIEVLIDIVLRGTVNSTKNIVQGTAAHGITTMTTTTEADTGDETVLRRADLEVRRGAEILLHRKEVVHAHLFEIDVIDVFTNLRAGTLQDLARGRGRDLVRGLLQDDVHLLRRMMLTELQGLLQCNRMPMIWMNNAVSVYNK